jgi:hypothetical protein
MPPHSREARRGHNGKSFHYSAVERIPLRAMGTVVDLDCIIDENYAEFLAGERFYCFETRKRCLHGITPTLEAARILGYPTSSEALLCTAPPIRGSGAGVPLLLDARQSALVVAKGSISRTTFMGKSYRLGVLVVKPGY